MLEQFLAALTAGSRRETFASGFGCVLFEVMCGCFCLFVLVLGFFLLVFVFFFFVCSGGCWGLDLGFFVCFYVEYTLEHS